jgi:tetratricopeptide (TPR) repeat protein
MPNRTLLAALAAFVLVIPIRAHTYKSSVALDASKVIQDARLKPGSYVFKVDEGKTELNILQKGKIVATVEVRWQKLPAKSKYSAIVSNRNAISQLVFSGSDQALVVPNYSRASYAAYNTAHSITVPQAKIDAMQAFIAKYNNPYLAPFAYRDLHQAYFELKDYVKTIEAIDKQLAFEDNGNPGIRLAALVQRGQAYGAGATNPALQTAEALKKTRDAAAQGLAALAEVKKPANTTEETFNNQKRAIGFVFDSVAGIAANYQKDWQGAENSFKAAMALNPNDATTHYRLGAAYVQDMPVQANDGFWELGRSMALKIQGGDQVKKFIRGRLIRYQQPGCDKAVDDEVNSILMASAAGPDRPADFNVPSAMDLSSARNDTNNFLPWLEGGGKNANAMWLATCGSQHSDVNVRVMETGPADGNSVTMKVFYAATREEMQAATTPNMEILVVDQPEARRIQTGDYIRFTGKLIGYTQSPFMLTWSVATIEPLAF